MKRGFTLHWNGDVGAEAHCVGQLHSRCDQFWAAVKRYHIEVRGWSDIAYSFGVCPHGIRYTGRGWYKNQFANGDDVVPPNDGADVYWFTVLAFVGGAEQPTPEMVGGIKSLIDEGRRRGHCGLRVTPHSDFKPKTCPGPVFTAYARAWDGQVFPLVQPQQPLPPEETDMRIIDCLGQPALVVFGDRTHKNLNKTERDALRSAGVPADTVTEAERATILALLAD